MMEEDLEYLKKNDLIAVLLLMFDNDRNTGKEDYLLQLIDVYKRQVMKMEEKGLRSAIMEGMRACADKSRKMTKK